MKYLLDTNVLSEPLKIQPDAAKWHASERARLQFIGKTPPFVDGQIAAIACVNNLILVTRNLSDFNLFSDLQIQNWHCGGRNGL